MTWLFFFSSVTFFLFCVPLSSWFLLILFFSFRLCWARQNEGWASCYCLSCDRNSMCCTMFDIDLHLLLGADEVGVNHVRWSMYHTCCSWRVPEYAYQHCCCWNCPSFRVFISFTTLGLGFLFFMLANWYVQMCDNFVVLYYQTKLAISQLLRSGISTPSYIHFSCLSDESGILFQFLRLCQVFDSFLLNNLSFRGALVDFLIFSEPMWVEQMWKRRKEGWFSEPASIRALLQDVLPHFLEWLYAEEAH